MEKYFLKSKETVLEEFNVSQGTGLSTNQVESSISKHGYNELLETKKDSLIKVFFDQFKDLSVIILIIAALISMFMKNVESTIVIFAVLILNAILGTVQHVKAEKSLDALKSLSSPKAKVLRNGEKIEIVSRDVAVGDILLLEAGDFVTADARIIENYSLSVNESSLTGEAENVLKTSDDISNENIPLGDQKNMVFSGTLVTYGRATAVVCATGMNTEIGKIASLLNTAKEKKTPLQVSLDDFGKKLAIGVILVCILVFFLTVYRGSTLIDSLMFAVALAVAAIPEALSSIVTIVLALGTQKMAKQNAIIRNLKAVEGLGSVSIICSDKTGTLTQNKMTVKGAYVNDTMLSIEEININNHSEKFLIDSSVLCNDSESEGGKEIGDPTEVALVNLAQTLNLKTKDIRDAFPRIAEIPFDSDRKLMSTLNKIDNKHLLLTKGAVDVMLPKMKSIHIEGEVLDFTSEHREKVEEANKSFSENGLRVLAFGYKEMSSSTDISTNDEKDFIFLGLVSMIDPPRVESKMAVSDCKTAGIKAIMITGDHKITASAIAREIGILEDGDEAIDGIELDSMSDEELKNRIRNISVYARVSPEHKIRIVKAFQELGEIVAMTGDGVNDAPALKQADIGISMGITGTEVAKDASSMILTDDNFATIIKSVANGRNIYTNIQNAIKFLLSGNTAGIFAVLYASLAMLPTPFAPVHLLFINLLTDSLPAVAIGLEKPKNDLLKQKPRKSNESILTKPIIKAIAVEGFIIAVCTIIAYYIGSKSGDKHVASTMAFSTLCLARLFHGFNCRWTKSLFKIGFFSNKYTWYAFIVGSALLAIVLSVPPFMRIFETVALTGEQAGYMLLLAFIPTIIIQTYKVIVNDRK
ncbi:cation-translocating P-type ATPase [Clostridium cylindrosporum]|uniref:P-type Ca(2+) transporter n=1 Tax=Clostridium cylindrosporum DSM 605 TaxID=1121307 RepID=A0A0J8G6C8_CLOCY|nr:cation-translocating P-type ATPase [Clostridium cylindrosporum]KMT23161.1 calcium-transporting ATPase 1 [Clostridium cylindrosporum DSM 605]